MIGESQNALSPYVTPGRIEQQIRNEAEKPVIQFSMPAADILDFLELVPETTRETILAELGEDEEGKVEPFVYEYAPGKWALMTTYLNPDKLTFGFTGLEATKLVESARIDSLTGLGNTTAFHEQLSRIAAYHQRCANEDSPPVISVGYIEADCNFLNNVNNTKGHISGDSILDAVGTLLQLGANRPGDSAFRKGGDEFAIFAEDTTSQGILHIVEKLRDNKLTVRALLITKYGEEDFNKKYGHLPPEVLDNPPSIAIGSAVLTNDNNLVDVIEAADKAMRDNKERQTGSRGRN